MEPLPYKALSVIVPALNEEGSIQHACEAILRAAQKHLPDYEILVFDDGSVDQTSEFVKKLQLDHPRISLFQNPVSRGIGYNYWAGLTKARHPYTMLVPGDNEITQESLEAIFSEIGSAEMLVVYPLNPEIRPLTRYILSKIFTTFFNFLFRTNLRYYNGPNVIQTSLARPFAFSTDGFAYMASMLVQLIKGGYTYKEVGYRLRSRKTGKSKALSLKNLISVVIDIVTLFWKVNVKSAGPPR